jgi:hypothetical protein
MSNSIEVSLFPYHKEQGKEWDDTAAKFYEAQTMRKHFESLEKNLMKQLLIMSFNLDSKSENFVLTNEVVRKI